MSVDVVVVKGFSFIHTDFSPFVDGMILASFEFLYDVIDFCRNYQLRYGGYFKADEGLRIVHDGFEVCSFLGSF